LDLINRQKAEIDRYSVERENLDEIVRALVDDLIVGAKQTTVKEFAERLRKKLIDGGLYPVFVKNKIAETEKEMVGDGNAK
jgi:hypothetical protein